MATTSVPGLSGCEDCRCAFASDSDLGAVCGSGSAAIFYGLRWLERAGIFLDLFIGCVGVDDLEFERSTVPMPHLFDSLENACGAWFLEQPGAGPTGNGIDLYLWAWHVVRAGDQTIESGCRELDGESGNVASVSSVKGLCIDEYSRYFGCQTLARCVQLPGASEEKNASKQ